MNDQKLREYKNSISGALKMLTSSNLDAGQMDQCITKVILEEDLEELLHETDALIGGAFADAPEMYLQDYLDRLKTVLAEASEVSLKKTEH